MNVENSPHADTWSAETAALVPSTWERWATEVEALLGHSIDGDQATDGYSADALYGQWRNGLSPAAAVLTIPIGD